MGGGGGVGGGGEGRSFSPKYPNSPPPKSIVNSSIAVAIKFRLIKFTMCCVHALCRTEKSYVIIVDDEDSPINAQ